MSLETQAKQPASATVGNPAPESPDVQTDACWSRIGVYGDSSCPELRKFIHCRNCPVHSRSAVALLDRSLPAGYREEWTEHFSRTKKAAAPHKTSALLFRINAEWLALPTEAFQEVAERRPIHSLPHRRQGIVVGLVNIRGELLICVSVSRVLGMEEFSSRKTRTVYDRLMVVKWDGQRLAFPVDEVHGIHRFDPGELQQPPATLAKAAPNYTRSLLPFRRQAAGLLDVDRLFCTLNQNLA